MNHFARINLVLSSENYVKIKYHSLVIKVPKIHRFPHIRINPIKWTALFVSRHKVLIFGVIFSVALVTVFAGATYRGYFLVHKTLGVKDTLPPVSSSPQDSPTPIDSPSPLDDPVLGVSDNSGSSYSQNTVVVPTPSPSPVPTPSPKPTPTSTPSNSNNSNSSGSSNCSTGAGVANSWYSDVYPASPISASNGSATLNVVIRDCGIHAVSSSSTLTISLNSGDPATQINGNNLPYSVSTQNGQISFTVTSQNAGTVTLSIRDTTDSFDITDTNNHNPSINFSGSSASPNPSPTPTPGPSPTLAPSPSPSTSPNSSPTPTP